MRSAYARLSIVARDPLRGVQASREEKRNQAFASDIKTYAVQSELHLKIKVFSHHP
ncbi:hypothetical protein [Bradyrhizobium sp. CCBAU 45384]|uniref:hypothetical protein n=1 Tax=Bradyrhizobium sp. CCBAU 45384 TaxID=858428 RepID=UPI0023066CD5|nr:hypothetical protein [Bradyrhizobium sp. CCBAU 45384]